MRDVILIPSWIAESLARGGRSLSDLTDLAKLRECLSLQDLAGLLALNQNKARVLGFDPGFCLGYGLHSVWTSALLQPANAHPDFEFLANTLQPLASDANILNATISRLTGAENPASIAQLKQPFEKCDLGARASGVILYPGFFNNVVDADFQFKLVDTILQVLYVHFPHSEVGRTDLAKRYLQLLAERHQSVG